MMKCKSQLCVGAVFLAALALPGEGAVLINEIFYHSPTENVRECFVELYNPGTNAVSLAGWRFTKGIPYGFPTNTTVTLGPRAYLVVAADAATFTNNYPGINNFVAGWSGEMRSHLELRDAAGDLVNEVNFSNDGDWAARVLTTNGFAHFGHWGWRWTSAHDGLGSSLELMNPSLPNSYGHNWTSSSVLAGTPGRPNSVSATNIPPILTGVAHNPIIPQPTDVVTVSARLIDEHTNGAALTLYYRNGSLASPPTFTAAPMYDDGTHEDGLNGDGIFGAILPPQPNGTVVEFYLLAQDREGATRRYPNVIPASGSARTANLLYQVDAGVYSGAQPVYRIIMTEIERAELYAISRGCPDSESDAQMNATWITVDGELSGGTSTQLRYNAGVRNRGHGTRIATPPNYHVNIPGDRSWKGGTGINLNANYAYSQVLGSAVVRRAGVPMPLSRPVQVRVNGINLASGTGNSFGSYAANEQYSENFIQRALALDGYGNAYRGIRNQVNCGSISNGVAELEWFGSNWAVAGYTNAYFKENNLLENDWSDLIDLIAVLNSTNGYALANYAADVTRRVNVEQWMRYMAVNTLVDNNETCLANGAGDDYGLYRGTNDTRFQALPYDLDDTFGRGATPTAYRRGIWRMNALPVVSRFMKTPEFAPIYYRSLRELADTVFMPAAINALVDQLFTGYLPQNYIDNLKAYNESQRTYVLSQIPLTLTVIDTLPRQNGFPYTTTSSVALHGNANAISTRQVLVNGVPAAWTAWTASWTNTNVALRPGLNRVLVQALDQSGVEFERVTADIWFNDGSTTAVGGTITGNSTWSPGAGPYLVTSSLTIAGGATLTIEPGTSVYLGSNVNFTVAEGGRVFANGTSNAPIRFTVPPGATYAWGGIIINGSLGSPESRFAYTLFESNSTTCIHVSGGSLWLDHSTFGTTTQRYLSLDQASFLLSRCYFPSTTAEVELIHGTGGLRADGHGIIRESYFGTSSGYSDIIDFTSGNRELGQPILQIYNNVFAGTTDDHLDLDGADAWVEGNIFLHAHRNGSPDSSSAVSGGSNGSDTSQITVIGNIFYDCDQAASAKQGNFYTLINNTIVRTTRTGGEDTAAGVINLQDPGSTYGAGMYLEGNIIVDAEQLARNYVPGQSVVTFNGNILPFAWTGPGATNLVATPLLKYIPELAETYFQDWQSAQVLRDWFSLQPGSPGRGTGPNGADQGGLVLMGASVSGEPVGTTSQNNATLRVGVARTGFGIPSTGWPYGSGYTHYQWRLDGGTWSSEIPMGVPISLTGLANGAHRVEVRGKRDCGFYQDDPLFGPDARATSSRSWVVDTGYVPPVVPTIRLNELLAQNSTALTNAGSTPDLIELYNYGSSPVELAGLSLSDNRAVSNKFTFPAGTPPLGPRQHLTLFADNELGSPGTHLGFSLKASGDDLFLFDRAANGNKILDSLVFGVQIPDYSIGRGVDGTWVLCRPTFGTNNVAQPLGDPRRLVLNEWLADELFLANNDFIELYNPEPLPVSLEGCSLSDAEGALKLSPIPPLTFVGPDSYQAFVADGDPEQGADHLAFKLDPNTGTVLLTDANSDLLDVISYGPQTTDVSQGRSPNGTQSFVSFLVPTPGAANPVPSGVISVTNVTALMVNLVDINTSWRYDTSGGTNLGTAWHQVSYPAESTWPEGTGLFGYDTTPEVYPYPFRTPINASKIAVYYRTHFQWNGSLSNYTLVSTNYVDDGAVFYLNGARMSSSIRMPNSVSYITLATGSIAVEGTPEYLWFTNRPVLGDNVLAVEVHQVANTSDDAFGMQLNAVQFATNVITTIRGIPVVLNEVFASNPSSANAAGATADWVELFNHGTNTLNLAGLSLTDNPDQPRKYVFPDPSPIVPGGYLLLYCNNDLPASTNNTGFALDAHSGSVLLFDNPAQGGGLLDGVNYGLQAADFSIGRIPSGSGNWGLTLPSAGEANVAAGLASVASLKVNEWMADPVTGNDWFELHNRAGLPVSLSGLYFTDDLLRKTLSPVPPLSFIGVGANAFVKFTADNDPNAGADHVAFALGKGGEAIGLFSPVGTLIDAVNFGPQQTGVSEGRFPDGSDHVVGFAQTSSPAESNYLPLPNVVVNEVLTHTDAPLEDAIELYNAGASAIDIGGWFISNSGENLKKYRVPDNTSIPGLGFRVFYEKDFNATNGASIPFTLNSAHGDRVYLSQADGNGDLTGYRAPAIFGAADNGVSIGRVTNSVGRVDLVSLAGRSFGVDNPATVEQFRSGLGAVNLGPRVGPLVINEVLFYPPLTAGEDETRYEFIELHNLAPDDLPLFDPLAPTNTWQVQGGVDFRFPRGATVPPQGFVLMVNFNPETDLDTLATFRSRYGLTSSIRLFGPYGGNLNNAGDLIQIFRPDTPQGAPHPDAGFVPEILLEQVHYLPAAPWPTGAAGTGLSLQRRVGSSYGNDPANWQVNAPTAGAPNTSNPGDLNADGLPDAWQAAHFGSYTNPLAAPAADPDSDEFNNLQEYLAGTNPALASSFLKIDAVQASGGNRLISFTAVAGLTYSILFQDDLKDPLWFRLANIPAQGATGPVGVTDSTVGGTPARFYRLVTPALP